MAWLWIPFGLTPKPDASGVRYADVYARAVAAAVDVYLLFLLLGGLFREIGMAIYAGVDPETINQLRQSGTASTFVLQLWHSPLVNLWLLNALIQFMVIAIVVIAAQFCWGSTPGKWLLGLKIVRVNTLEPVYRWQYILRFLAYIPSMLPLMLGIFWASFNRQHRGWHDYIAGTVVIHTRSYEWYRDRAVWLYRKLRGKTAALPPEAE